MDNTRRFRTDAEIAEEFAAIRRGQLAITIKDMARIIDESLARNRKYHDEQRAKLDAAFSPSPLSTGDRR